MGYRVVVKMSKYFTDERSSCYIYINENMKEVTNLETYLTELFNIEGSFCLLKENSLLPSCENIHVLKENEVISVIPLAEPFVYNHNSPRSVDENIENNEKDEKEVKKKKRKKNKEPSSAEVSNIDIDADEKTIKENSVTTLANGYDGEKTSNLNNTKLFTAMKNIEEFHSKFYPQEDEDELESMKAKALNTLKEHFPVNINGVSEGRIKKRKRIRIRKSKKNNQIEILQSDSDSGKPQKNSTLLLTNGKKSSHIRFSAPEKPINILQNDTVDKIDKTPRIIRGIQSNNVSKPGNIALNIHQNNLQNGDVEPDNLETFNDKLHTNRNQSTPIKKELNLAIAEGSNVSIESVVKHINVHPVVSFDKVNDNNIILFKMLKMTADYTPIISEHVLGRVLNLDAVNRSLKISILDGHKECTIPSGKFDLDNSDANVAENSLDVTWDQLIEPRIVSS